MAEVQRTKAALKALLRKSGRTYTDVASMLGVSLPTVGRFMSKGDISLETLARVCQWLGISLHDLTQSARAEGVPAFPDPRQDAYFEAEPKAYLYLRLLARGANAREIGKRFGISPETGRNYRRRLEELGLVSGANAECTLAEDVPRPADPAPGSKLFARLLPLTARDLTRHLVGQALQAQEGGIGSEEGIVTGKAGESSSARQEAEARGFFFALGTLMLRPATGREYRREMQALHEKYALIGRHESATANPADLKLYAALFGLDAYDPFVEGAACEGASGAEAAVAPPPR